LDLELGLKLELRAGDRSLDLRTELGPDARRLS